MFRGLFSSCVLAGALLLTPYAAAAEEPRRPCKADEERLCAGVPYGHGQVRVCLEDHADELSPECHAALADGLQMTQVDIPQQYHTNALRLEGWLSKPQRAGRSGGVVILPGCNGLDAPGWWHALGWAHWFNRQGLAALVLDGYTPRGLRNICGAGKRLPPRERLQDLYAAARYLSSLPEIDADKIVAVGFSHGGWTLMEAAFAPGGEGVNSSASAEAGHPKLAGLIAFYPFCDADSSRQINTPLLILAGGKDDWTDAAPCARFARQPNARVKVYPEARHSFDVKRPARSYLGHTLEYDKAADEDAHAQVAQFLAERQSAPINDRELMEGKRAR